ncbi:hypothetical protein ACJX0J_038509, partial [Zea mays]
FFTLRQVLLILFWMFCCLAEEELLYFPFRPGICMGQEYSMAWILQASKKTGHQITLTLKLIGRPIKLSIPTRANIKSISDYLIFFLKIQMNMTSYILNKTNEYNFIATTEYHIIT